MTEHDHRRGVADEDQVDARSVREPRVLAAAIRVGGTRLIDNVVMEGDAE